ncbi:transmembrane protein, putative [Bodo saltans]|uniref:Transmembrane protein, putative n=1 Tax=Bodo saltans TaxID=75058 RepID=A0A0S4JRJ8_BODSA|nr:transmembrane protein, putative [Bodo saltans]|eukprot:CUG92606.1 transmembrane protein, putative [Bodo saltans]
MPPRNTRTSRITDTSPHTSFVDRAGFKIMYVTVLVALWALLHASHAVTNAGEAWNWVLRIHAVVSYVFFHWIKGAPETGMLEDEKLQLMTFWEQIDEGYFGTPSRRFLTFVPFGVFFVTLMLNVQHDDLSTLVVNALFTLVCLVPKLESFFKVRIFGINKD